MQRVAIARAMVNKPEILLADEPTGNLDTKRSAEIVQVLQELNRNGGLTVIMVTHNQELARHADRMFEMKDGQIYQIEIGGIAPRYGHRISTAVVKIRRQKT